MEGTGSRLSRASSRYGSAAVFTGPVRRWKKRWVHVSPPPAVTYRSSLSNGGGEASRLRLCRWTPIASSTDGDGDRSSSAVPEEPPRRKFRYTPVAALDEKKVPVKQVDDEATQCTTWPTSKSGALFEKPDIRDKRKMTQASDEKQLPPRDSYDDYLNSGLCLNH